MNGSAPAGALLSCMIRSSGVCPGCLRWDRVNDRFCRCFCQLASGGSISLPAKEMDERNRQEDLPNGPPGPLLPAKGGRLPPLDPSAYVTWSRCFVENSRGSGNANRGNPDPISCPAPLLRSPIREAAARRGRMNKMQVLSSDRRSIQSMLLPSFVSPRKPRGRSNGGARRPLLGRRGRIPKETASE